MKMVMCSVRDAAAEAWLKPMCFQAKGQAIRAFADAVNEDGSDFGKHVEDYALFLVGHFDELSGEVEAAVPPEVLILAVNCLNGDNNV